MYIITQIYNGSKVNKNKLVIDKLSGNNIPQDVTEDSNEMLVRFTTDGSVGYTGFMATFNAKS